MGISVGKAGAISEVDRQCVAGDKKLMAWKGEVEERLRKNNVEEVGRRRVRRSLRMEDADDEWEDIEEEDINESTDTIHICIYLFIY